MDLKIFEKAEPTKQPVRLRLIPGPGLGTIALSAVNELGNIVPQGNLITFYPDGSARRNECVSEVLGFRLDSSGRIQIS